LNSVPRSFIKVTARNHHSEPDGASADDTAFQLIGVVVVELVEDEEEDEEEAEALFMFSPPLFAPLFWYSAYIFSIFSIRASTFCFITRTSFSNENLIVSRMFFIRFVIVVLFSFVNNSVSSSDVLSNKLYIACISCCCWKKITKEKTNEEENELSCCNQLPITPRTNKRSYVFINFEFTIHLQNNLKDFFILFDCLDSFVLQQQ
jgi:hypothetical protein